MNVYSVTKNADRSRVDWAVVGLKVGIFALVLLLVLGSRPPPTAEAQSDPSLTVAGGTAVVEGVSATFTITADASPASDLTVNYTISQTGSFVAADDLGTGTVTLDSSGTTATVTIPTVADTVDEANGTAILTINTGTGYTVGTPSSAAVTVNDDDATPLYGAWALVSDSNLVGAQTATIDFDALTGDVAGMYTGSSSNTPNSPHDGAYAQYVMGSGATAVTTQLATYGADGRASRSKTGEGAFSAWDTTPADETVTDADLMGDDTQSYIIQLSSETLPAPDNLADPGQTWSNFYGVLDTDAANNRQRIYNSAWNARYWERSRTIPPNLSVSGGTAVTEGTAATFTATLTANAAASTTVNYTVSQSGSYVASANVGAKTATIAAGSASVTITVATVDDSAEETDGSVTVTLNAGTNYSVSTARSASVVVKDDEGPTLTRNQNSDTTKATAAGDYTPTTFTNWSTGEQAVFFDSVSGDASNTESYRVDVPANWSVDWTASSEVSTYDLAGNFDGCDLASERWELIYYADTGPRVGLCADAAAGVLVMRNGAAADSPIFRRYALFPDNSGGAPTATPLPADGEVIVSWTDNTNAPDGSITGHEYRYKTTAASEWGSAQSVAAGLTNLVVETLTNGTSYDFQVRALYYGTPGTWSATAAVTPGDDLVTNLSESYNSYMDVYTNPHRATSFTTGSNEAAYYLLETVTLNFVADDGNPGNIVVAVYDDDSDNPGHPGASIGTLTGSNPNEAGNQTYTAAGSGLVLQPDTDYWVVLGATGSINSNEFRVTYTSSNNDTGASTGWSIANSSENWNGSAWFNSSYPMRFTVGGGSVAMPATPGVPSNVAAAVGSREIFLSWDTVTGADTYDYRYKVGDSATWGDAISTSTNTSVTVSGLSDDVAYDFQVRSNSVAVQSAWSATVTATPTATAVFGWAATQANLSLSEDDAVSITLPGAGGGVGNADAVYSFTGTLPTGLGIDNTTRVLSGTPTTPAGAASITWKAAKTDNTAITQVFTITITQDTVPGAPSVFALESAADDSIRFGWTLENAGGLPVSGYDVQYEVSGSWQDVAHSGTVKEASVGGLTVGAAYRVRVRASNSLGDGAWSTAESITAGDPAAGIVPLGDGCRFSQPSLGVIPALPDSQNAAGPYKFCVPGASVLTADDANSRFSQWSDRSSLTCNSSATLSLAGGCHQIGVKGCGSGETYHAGITLTGEGIAARSCEQSYGEAVSAIITSSRYYEGNKDWTPMESGLIMGKTQVTFHIRPTGDWHIWLPAAVSKWGECGLGHNDMTAAEAARLTRWPDAVSSGESLLLEGCATTKPIQVMAAPVTGQGQSPDFAVAVGVAGGNVQVAPEPLIDRGWLTERTKQQVGVILFLVPLIVVPSVWAVTKNPVVAAVVTIGLLVITALVLQLPIWSYLSILLAAGAAFVLGMILKK